MAMQVGGGPGLGEFGRGEVAVGGMWSVHVLVDSVVFDQDSSFEERVELPQVEEFVAEAAVERFDPGFLPW